MSAAISTLFRAKARYTIATSTTSHITSSRSSHFASRPCFRASTFSPKRGPQVSRYITTSTKGAGNGSNATWAKYILALSATAGASWYLYTQQGTLRLDSGKTFTHLHPLAPDDEVSLANAQAIKSLETLDLPEESAILTTAPNVPPPITRDHPVLLNVDLTTTAKLEQLTNQYKYEKWTFNDTVPGPFIRARVGDVVNLKITNHDESGMPHNIDCHAFLGPGGGAPLTTVGQGETKSARFKLQKPGLYVYHCAVGPVGVHIGNGMYGLMYVQPEKELPAVDKEYYVMQSEFYHEPPEKDENGQVKDTVEFSWSHALREAADVVVFNGKEGALTKTPLKANLNETVRIFFGNGGPNLTSSFHVIGSNFDKVYRDSDVLSPPGQCVQTVSVPPGGSTIVDMNMVIPGTYTLVDHAIFRLEKGASGYLMVSGEPTPHLYHSNQAPMPCEGCKLHP
ncbi:Cupredoxin [Aspergillus avenaceus]|uniref:Copper-containing nitrite reductase n=1 Tax=Aspergillus avenaceus TaxID=36643 RepID=A0A5N6TU63_ASPAV|nr:Cupredoxin [Aspergillus avenaceus]